MLMDQEWDTRGWNATKIQAAVDTLYEEIEHCEDDSRRELATTMLLRLMETHEGRYVNMVQWRRDQTSRLMMSCCAFCATRCCGLRRDILTNVDQQGIPDTLQTHQQYQDIPHGSTGSGAGRVVCTRAVK